MLNLRMCCTCLRVCPIWAIKISPNLNLTVWKLSLLWFRSVKNKSASEETYFWQIANYSLVRVCCLLFLLALRCLRCLRYNHRSDLPAGFRMWSELKPRQNGTASGAIDCCSVETEAVTKRMTARRPVCSKIKFALDASQDRIPEVLMKPSTILHYDSWRIRRY